jgi:hypothetical protein
VSDDLHAPLSLSTGLLSFDFRSPAMTRIEVGGCLFATSDLVLCVGECRDWREAILAEKRGASLDRGEIA